MCQPVQHLSKAHAFGYLLFKVWIVSLPSIYLFWKASYSGEREFIFSLRISHLCAISLTGPNQNVEHSWAQWKVLENTPLFRVEVAGAILVC